MLLYEAPAGIQFLYNDRKTDPEEFNFHFYPESDIILQTGSGLFAVVSFTSQAGVPV